MDLDKDNSLSQEELKKLIVQVNFGKIPWDADEIVGKMMEQLDVNGDQFINEDEFISGFLKWLRCLDNGSPMPSPSNYGPGNISPMPSPSNYGPGNIYQVCKDVILNYILICTYIIYYHLDH